MPSARGPTLRSVAGVDLLQLPALDGQAKHLHGAELVRPELRIGSLAHERIGVFELDVRSPRRARRGALRRWATSYTPAMLVRQVVNDAPRKRECLRGGDPTGSVPNRLGSFAVTWPGTRQQRLLWVAHQREFTPELFACGICAGVSEEIHRADRRFETPA